MKAIPQPSFRNKAQTIDFLKKLSNKDNYLRVIAWLHYFDLIDLNCLSKSIFFLYDNYHDNILKHIQDIQKPVDSLSSEEERYLIEIDTQRSHFWYQELIKESNINQSKAPTDDLNVQRILVAIRLTDDFYEYLQGFDRYACVCMTISLEFATHIGESIDFAEAIAFFLCQKILRIVDIGKFTKDYNFANKHFSLIDKKVMESHPKEYQYLISMNTTSMFYALKWELVSFADQYNYKDLLLLWDQIILHKSNHTDFMIELCTAHIELISFNDPTTVLETIQAKNDWDVIKVIQITNEHLKKRRAQKVAFCVLIIIAVMIFVINKFL